MAKMVFQTNPQVQQIFEDLEKYLEFCVTFGYKFNEKELYENKSYTFRQFTKYLQGKPVKDNWETDAKPE